MSNFIFEKVIYVAPNYKKWKGGISSVIIEYKKTIGKFNYHPSTDSANIILTFLVFPFLVAGYITKMVLNKQYQIVHIHGASIGSFYRKYVFFLISKYFLKRKVLYHIHGAKYHIFYQESPFLIKKAVRHMINHCDGLIVLSNHWKNFFANHFSPNKIFIISNIVGYIPPKLNLSEKNNGKIKLLFLGRIGDRKGIFDLLELFKLKHHELGLTYEVIVGGDGETQRLKEFVRNNDLESVVRFVGFVEGEEKEKILQEADIYVLPSYNEGLPISILEAMSYSMPIVSTNVGGIPEIVENKYNGYLVEPGDKEALLKAILNFSYNRELISSFGKRSYEKVYNHFPEAVKEQLIQVYEELTDTI